MAKDLKLSTEDQIQTQKIHTKESKEIDLRIEKLFKQVEYWVKF